jgi:circadian clock protein KaiC
MENDIITSFEETKTKPSKFELRKSKTGIQGLDDITYGGIPENRPTVLVGAAGTGKTVLAMQYIITRRSNR